MKPVKPFFVILVFVLFVGMACNFGATPPSPATEPPPVENPTDEPQPQPASGAVTSLDDLKDAVIQIESVGTFVDPQVGLLVNAGGYGSGFIIDPSGIAVTNNHVVTGAATLRVFLNGQQYNARVLGASECADLAVIQVQGSNFKYLNWYAGDAKTGTEVYSAGFPLGEPQFTLTKGIISKEKAEGHTNWASLDYVLSHDATINPGNSGGPLVSQNAEVVGVNYRSRPNFNQYFAIDAKTAETMLDDLKSGKDVWSIGVNGTAVRSEDGSLSGIWVVSVKSGSPADKAGVKPGDILYQMEGLVLATDGTMKDYCDILRSRAMTDTMSLTVIRFATSEILEGQLNGRELAVTGYFGDSGGNSGSTGSTGSSGSTSGQTYFVEQFDSDPQWYYEVIKGRSSSDAKKATYKFDFGRMIFDITDKDLYAYYVYEGNLYENSRTTIRFENRGVNSQQVSLVCRMSDEGWYEFAVQSDGLWFLYAVVDGYNLMANGGSTAVRQGKETNEYAFVCDDNKLSFFINGVEPKGSPYTDRKYVLRRGNVGFSVSSLVATPVKIEVDWFEIAEP
jgi:S1-C subfamily serine protease